jgi:hypothetical protein
VAGSIPDDINLPLRFDSVSNINEHRKYFLGGWGKRVEEVKVAGA